MIIWLQWHICSIEKSIQFICSTQQNQEVLLHGSEKSWSVVNRILANVPNPAMTSVRVGYLWSDGFKSTYTQQKDHSVWVMTVTLSLLSVHAASKHHLGVLTLGWSQNDHQQVFNHFMNEVHTNLPHWFVLQIQDSALPNWAFIMAM